MTKALRLATFSIILIFSLLSYTDVDNKKLQRDLFDYPLFEQIRDGLTLDLNDPLQRDIFYLYVKVRLARTAAYYQDSIEQLKRAVDFVNSNEISEDALEIFDRVTVKNRGAELMTLRPLSLFEKPFRGCLGADCSTGTRFTRALEPHHIYFAIEKPGSKSIGQVELVLGDINGNPVAFLERFQVPSRLTVKEITLCLESLRLSLRAKGYSFGVIKNLVDYAKLGHPIGNNRFINQRLQTAFDTNFKFVELGEGFQRREDSYEHKNESFVYIAAKASETHLHSISGLVDLYGYNFEMLQTPPFTASVDVEVEWNRLYKKLVPDLNKYIGNSVISLVPVSGSGFEQKLQEQVQANLEPILNDFNNRSFKEIFDEFGTNSIAALIIEEKIKTGELPDLDLVPIVFETYAKLHRSHGVVKGRWSALVSRLYLINPVYAQKFSQRITDYFITVIHTQKILKSSFKKFDLWALDASNSDKVKVNRALISKLTNVKTPIKMIALIERLFVENIKKDSKLILNFWLQRALDKMDLETTLTIIQKLKAGAAEILNETSVHMVALRVLNLSNNEFQTTYRAQYFVDSALRELTDESLLFNLTLEIDRLDLRHKFKNVLEDIHKRFPNLHFPLGLSTDTDNTCRELLNF